MAIYFDNSAVGVSLSEDISAELTEYTWLNVELKEVIDSLPDAGSEGGSSFKTCTLAPSSNTNGWEYYLLTYTTVENGEIVVKEGISMSDKPYEPITVLCGTIMCYLVDDFSGECFLTGGFEELNSSYNGGIFILAPSEHGVSGTIEVSYGPM